MASNKPPQQKIIGIRGSIPSGYILGRVSAGYGDVELLSPAKAQSAGLIPSALPVGGDLSGTTNKATVIAINGQTLPAPASAAHQVLMYGGSALMWQDMGLAGGSTGQVPTKVNGSDFNYTFVTPHYLIAGGTTGQVLTKNSNTDYDVTWATPSAGGGGGAASIQDDGTNFYVAVSDTDGQVVLDGAGDPIFVQEVFPAAAIPIDGSTIVAAAGLLSAKVPRGAFRVHNSAAQAVTPSVANLLAFDTKDFDASNWFNTSTGKYTPQVAGYYMFITNATITLSDGDFAQAGVKVNNTTISNGPQYLVGGTGVCTAQAITLVHLNGTTDFAQAKLYPGAASSVSGIDTYFAGFLIQPD